VEIGTIAEWVGGVATVLATAAAVFAGVIAYRAYRREEDRDRQSLAAGVHAWLARDTADGDQRLMVTNLGSAPIYEACVAFVVNGHDALAPRGAKTWQILPPGQYVVAHGTWGWSLPDPVDDPRRYQPYTRSTKHLVQRMTFTDARGVRWQREGAGRLTELSDPPPTSPDAR